MTTREAIVAEARTWIGTPFAHQGRLRRVGVDCIGLVGMVALVLALPGAEEWYRNPEFHNYGRQPDPEFLLRGCDLFLDRTDAALPGDVLVLRFRKAPQHFGIFAGETMIHALESVGKVVEARLDAKWRARVVRVYRFRGIE